VLGVMVACESTAAVRSACNCSAFNVLRTGALQRLQPLILGTEMADSIQMPFREVGWVGPNIHVLHWV